MQSAVVRQNLAKNEASNEGNLTWPVSLFQKTLGGGFPVTWHLSDTARPTPTTLSWGVTINLGCECIVSLAGASTCPTLFSARQIYVPSSCTLTRSIRRLRSSRILDRPWGIWPSSRRQMMVGGGSPRAWHWNSTFSFSSTSTSWGDRVKRGLSERKKRKCFCLDNRNHWHFNNVNLFVSSEKGSGCYGYQSYNTIHRAASLTASWPFKSLPGILFKILTAVNGGCSCERVCSLWVTVAAHTWRHWQSYAMSVYSLESIFKRHKSCANGH